MSAKFNRKYEITVYPIEYKKAGTSPFGLPLSFTAYQGTAITISNPFTMTFDIKREANAVASAATFQIYNLGESTRNKLYKDLFSQWGLRRIVVKAGFESQGQLPVVFDGCVNNCSSQRQQGATSFVTTIEADNWSFPMYNSFTTQSFAGMVKKQKVVDQLIKDVVATGSSSNHVARGYVRQYTEDQWNVVISGNSWERLRTETNNQCFIDNGKVHVVADNEYIPSANFVINSDSGLLGAPKRYENHVVAEMIFEPSLVIGQRVSLLSDSQKMLNGYYKVYGIHHYGTISDAVGGRCQTTVTLFSMNKNSQLLEQSNSLV